MNFYSGFSLKDDNSFFKEYRDDTLYSISGFSYGAILAFKEVQKRLQENKRVDKLQLFSPAFFQTKTTKFKKLQMLGFTKDKENYIEKFLQLCFAPYSMDSVTLGDPTKEQLEELLYYEWSGAELLELEEQGVVIEVYLGGQDAIIDVKSAREFFVEFSTVTYIKDANHFLQTS